MKVRHISDMGQLDQADELYVLGRKDSILISEAKTSAPKRLITFLQFPRSQRCHRGVGT